MKNIIAVILSLLFLAGFSAEVTMDSKAERLVRDAEKQIVNKAINDLPTWNQVVTDETKIGEYCLVAYRFQQIDPVVIYESLRSIVEDVTVKVDDQQLDKATIVLKLMFDIRNSKILPDNDVSSSLGFATHFDAMAGSWPVFFDEKSKRYILLPHPPREGFIPRIEELYLGYLKIYLYRSPADLFRAPP